MSQRNDRGEAFAELVFEVAAFFFRLRLVSQRGGTLGFLRTVASQGPITVPDLARMRPTSRQRMQQLADELVADGLIEFANNPHHKKSKLMRLTRQGHTRYRAMLKQLHDIGAEVTNDIDEQDLRRAVALIQCLRARTRTD